MSDFAAHFCRPPARAYQQESPVGKEFRGLAFESVADELEDPSHDEESKCDGPEAVNEDGQDEEGERKHDQRDADGVADAVDRILMAGGILRDPLVPGAVA